MDTTELFSLIKKDYEEKKVPLKKKLSLINQLKSVSNLPYNLTKLIELREELYSTNLNNFQSEILAFLNNYPLKKIEDVYTLFILTPTNLVNELQSQITSHYRFIYLYLIAKFYNLPLPKADNTVKILSLPYINDLQIDTSNLAANEINLYNDLCKQLNLLKLQNNDVFIEVLKEIDNEFVFFDEKLTNQSVISELFAKHFNKIAEKDLINLFTSLFARNISPNKILIPLLDYLIYYFDRTNPENLSFAQIKKIQPVFLARILFLLKEAKSDIFYKKLKIQKIDFVYNLAFFQDDYLLSLLLYSSMFYKKDLTEMISKLKPTEIKKVLKIVGRFYLIKNGNNLDIRKLVLKTYFENKEEEFFIENLNNTEIFENINRMYFSDESDYKQCINYIYNENTNDDIIFRYFRNSQIDQINQIKQLVQSQEAIFIKMILNKKLVLIKEIPKEDLIPHTDTIVFAFKKDLCYEYLELLLKILRENEVYKIIHSLKIPLTHKIRLLIKYIDSISGDKYVYIDKLGELVYLEQSTLNEYINCCWRNNYKFSGFNFDENFEEMSKL